MIHLLSPDKRRKGGGTHPPEQESLIGAPVPRRIHRGAIRQLCRDDREIVLGFKDDGGLLPARLSACLRSLWNKGRWISRCKRKVKRHFCGGRWKQAHTHGIEESEQIFFWRLIQSLQRYLEQPCKDTLEHRASVAFIWRIPFGHVVAS